MAILSKNLSLYGNTLPYSFIEHWEALLEPYVKSRLTSPNVEQELQYTQAERIFPVIWEAMLYRHFKKLEYEITADVSKKGQQGADLCVFIGGQRTWVEATILTPQQLPNDWLQPTRSGAPVARKVPHEEILLRWTTALVAKKNQLSKNRQHGSIAPSDACVVAVNSALLFLETIAWDEGQSRWPYAAECTFGIGPIVFQVDTNSSVPGKAEVTLRETIKKPSTGAYVPSKSFLNSEFSIVSALLGSSRLCCSPLISGHGLPGFAIRDELAR
jgi:hypothetical protein